VGAIDPYLYFGWNPLPAVERVRIDAHGFLPKGFSVAFAADFHIRDSTTDDYVNEVCDLIANLHADLLLLGGDYGESKGAACRLFDAFSRFTFPCGAYAVLGNNDREIFSNPDELRKVARMPLLVNESVRFPIGNRTLAIGGVDEMKHGKPDARRLFRRDNGRDYAILVSHYPVVPDFGMGGRANLVLSGHTHGGQINFLGLTTYALGFERHKAAHLAGMRDYGDVKLLVSTGIGMSKLPVRLGCRPRIHRIEFE
jgi:predicted MPP superfamily phosphohydrolase